MVRRRNTGDGENIDIRSHDGNKKTASGDRIINHGNGITEGNRDGSGSTTPANAK